MDSFFAQYITLLDDDSAMRQMIHEQEHQYTDIQETLDTQRPALQAVADAIRKQNRILLLGMGASHYLNHLFALQLRRLGWYAIALPASEFLSNPLPITQDLVMLTSFSGETPEVIASLDHLKHHQIVSITGNETGTLARQTQIGITISGGTHIVNALKMLAAMAYISADLQGVSKTLIYEMLSFQQKNLAEMHTAVQLLHAKNTLVTIGSGLFSALAHLFSHGGEQLSGRVIRSIEAEQLCYGSAEVLSPGAALLYFRQQNESETLLQDIMKLHEQSSCTLVVIDSSSLAPLEGAITLRCPVEEDIIAALAVFQTSQSLMLAYACGKNRNAGINKYIEQFIK